PASATSGAPASIAATSSSGWAAPKSAAPDVAQSRGRPEPPRYCTSRKPSSTRNSFASHNGGSQANGLVIRSVVVSGGGSSAAVPDAAPLGAHDASAAPAATVAPVASVRINNCLRVLS